MKEYFVNFCKYYIGGLVTVFLFFVGLAMCGVFALGVVFFVIELFEIYGN